MTTRIYKTQVEQTEDLTYAVDASDLGWPPGFFPNTVETDIGNKMPLKLMQLNDAYAFYSQTAGCVDVLVYND